MAKLELDSLTVGEGAARILHPLDLTVASGERLVVLGPSGSGKTTLLRAIAGVVTVSGGAITIDGRRVTHTAPRDRDVAMVDQQASLQPHLDVGDNVAFPLRLRRIADEEVTARVDAEARTFSLRRVLRRRPQTLSHGQRHEVALARSLVRRASVVLLDEPFAMTDPPRRERLLRELLEVQRGYGVTLIAATNDQRVAMLLGERLAVLEGGRLVQAGTTAELYAAPASSFVAGFVGSPPMNLVVGRVRAASSGVRVEAGPLRVRSFAPTVTDLAGRDVVVGIRPTDLAPDPTDAAVVVEEVVTRRAFLGSQVELGLAAPPGPDLTAVVDRDHAPQVGALVRLGVAPQRLHLFDPATGAALAHGV